MFRNKLEALDYHSPRCFDYEDEKIFRNFISWLENQKIRLYKVEDRAGLDRVDDDANWTKAYEKYLNDINLPKLNPNTDRIIQIEKLLAHAIRLEYSDNADKFNMIKMAPVNDFSRQDSNDQSLESIDYTSKEFQDGFSRIKNLLNMPDKLNDQTSVLQASAKLISTKFSPQLIHDILSKSNSSNNNNNRNSATEPKDNLASSSDTRLALQSIDLGFDTNDKELNEAAKILRLLHIKELRDLQTRINETIVLIQEVTANPKTDSSLGRVGK